MRGLLSYSQWFATFKRYVSVGVVNTVLHWLVFGLLFWGFGIGQATANLGAFVLAVTFSFFANARYTFKKTASLGRYTSFVSAMGGLSYLTGLAVESIGWHPLVTLLAFSALSLVCGYLYSTFCVFRT